LTRSRGRRLLAAVLALAAAGCSSAPRVIPLSESSEPPKPAARVADYQDAFQAITSVMGRDLGLPIPRVSLYLYPNRESLEQGLIAELSLEPTQARDAASFARGMGGSEKILVNEAALVRTPWPERIRFLSHELTHTIQYDLARGRRSTSAQWLREGFAEWVSYRTVDALGLGRYAEWRATRLRQFQKMRERKTVPSLDQLSTAAQWISWRSQLGGEVTYNQAFLAVDFLIERRSHPAAVEYFRLFARSDDRLANFRTAFSEDLSAFEREFAAYIDRLR
jgi:hypothetical protein